MAYAIYILIGLVLLVGGFFAVQSYLSYQEQQNKKENVKTGAQITLKRLDKNLPKLSSGNIRWRRIGHGQDVVGISRMEPEREKGSAAKVIAMLDQNPDIARKIKDHDARVQKLRDVASELAEQIEPAVRKQYEKDRMPEEGKPIIKRLPQDGWLIILQALINNGQYEDGLKGKIGEYWSRREDRCREILEKYGGDTYERFSKLLRTLRAQEEDLQKDLHRIQPTARSRR